MVLFNYSTKELTAKIVYYGPGLCGKTTNLQFVHRTLPENVRGKMLSLATKTDRTLFFDFLPIDLGQIRGMKTRVQLYTVPGQVFYNETRKLVLKGADGIVFVADSQQAMLGANAESFRNLEENLKGHGIRLADVPHVIQFNKRDLPKLSSIEELNAAVNKYNAPFYESVATTGIGVQDTLKAITKLVLVHLTRKYEGGKSPAAARPADAVAPPVAPPAVAATPVPVAAATVAPTSIPLSAAAAGPRESAPAPPRFGEREVDELVGEVRASEAPATRGGAQGVGHAAGRARAEEPVTPTAFEVDHGVDPDWSPAAESAIALDPDNTPDEPPAAPRAPRRPAPTVELSRPARDADLFEDPGVEVARMRPGTEQEIVVPVQLEDGPAARRFKLTVRLRLDPVD